jgi:hypothetical protein
MGANKRNSKKYKQYAQKYKISKPLKVQNSDLSGSAGFVSKYKADIDLIIPILREEGLFLKGM